MSEWRFTTLRPRDDIEKAMNMHGTAVWRACVAFFASQHDAQDAFQDAFLKYSLAEDKAFADEEHRKAWLITVATNVCRDMLRSRSRSDQPLDELTPAESLVSHDELAQPESRHREVLEAFHALDDPPRMPLFLALYEGYTAPEIAEMLDAPVNTVYSWISRGRKQLKEALS